MRDVTLVCGPPCGGKSTWVRANARPGDMVVDFDDIAVALGSPVSHRHDIWHRNAAGREYRRQLGEVVDHRGRAFVIRCAALGSERVSLASQIGATRTVLLVPDMDVTLARAQSRRDPVRHRLDIERWYREFSNTPSDERVTFDSAGVTSTDW